MTLRPIEDKIVLKPIEAEEKTPSGIVLPGNKEKEKTQQAEVIAVGPGGYVDGHEVIMQVKVGDKVLYSNSWHTEMKTKEGETFLVVRQNDILAIMED